MTEVLSIPWSVDGASYLATSPLRPPSPSSSPSTIPFDHPVTDLCTSTRPSAHPPTTDASHIASTAFSLSSSSSSSSRRSSTSVSPSPTSSSSSVSIPSPVDTHPSSIVSTVFTSSVSDPSCPSPTSRGHEVLLPPTHGQDDPIIFPTYEDVGYLDEPTTSITVDIDPSRRRRRHHPQPSTPTTKSRRPDLTATAEDDIAVYEEPSRHVDYLSYDWSEEDIWASWRHIVSRRMVYGNAPRLENASWRTWAKVRSRLPTVSPEKLNWLKDCDVTWLYGPLQAHRRRSWLPAETPAGSRLSKTNSFLTKKPILKKRSMSEVMLQKSRSSSSLLKQAAASVEAQRGWISPGLLVRARSMNRSDSDRLPSFTPSRFGSDETSSADASNSSSGLQTPGLGERRHIHFNNEVEQCIAVEIRDDDDDDDDDDAGMDEETEGRGIDHHLNPVMDDDDDDDDDESDDGLIMMNRASSESSCTVRSGEPTTPRRQSISVESRTIAMLPSTTLKCRDEDDQGLDEIVDESGLGRTNRAWQPRRPSPSPSQETLRPSRPSTNRLFDGDDEADMTWEPSDVFTLTEESHLIAGIASASAPSVPSSSSSSSSSSSRPPSFSTDHDEGGDHGHGLRRTPSGMFMPEEDDEDDIMAAGLFGRVVNTVNTARDIGHVIWNVGWRR